MIYLFYTSDKGTLYVTLVGMVRSLSNYRDHGFRDNGDAKVFSTSKETRTGIYENNLADLAISALAICKIDHSKQEFMARQCRRLPIFFGMVLEPRNAFLPFLLQTKHHLVLEAQ